MGAVSRAGRGCFWWAIVVAIAVVVIAAAVTTFIHHHRHRRRHGHGPSPGSTTPAQYASALGLSMLFLDIQKSGKLPKGNPIPWRGDSALTDGKDVGLDLSGGLYDAGDHIKFVFPMAFTGTLLAWSILEYGPQMNASGQLTAAKDNIRWITDFLIKAHPSSDVLFFQVGDPATDHACWERPENMDTTRPSYMLNSSVHGTDVVAEVAAAMASTSLVFKKEDSSYSDLLIKHAKELFDFATSSEALYSISVPAEKQFYNSTGYTDELLWASSWLFYATGDESYFSYVTGIAGEKFAKWGQAPSWLSWDNKISGVQVLLSRLYLLQPQPVTAQSNEALRKYKATADQLMCALMPDSPTTSEDRTEGGLIWVSQWNSIQHAVNSALLAVIYSDYLFTNQSDLSCSGTIYSSKDLRDFAMSQGDYILGHNPNKLSYLVGYGSSYPKFVHHRGASIPVDGTIYKCKQGFMWLSSPDPNPNIALGGLVGGPFKNDTFSDSRNNSMQNEPTTYNSAAMIGLTAGLSSSSQVALSRFS